MNTLSIYWFYSAQPYLLHWAIGAVLIYLFCSMLLHFYKGNSFVLIQCKIWRIAVCCLIAMPLLMLITPFRFTIHIPTIHWIYWSGFASYLSLTIFMIYSFGIIVTLSAYLIVHREIIFILYKHKIVEDGRTFELTKRLKAEFRIASPLFLYYTSTFQSPFIIWFFGFRLFIPNSFKNDLTPKDLEAVIRHELSHIRNSDILYNHLLSSLHMFLWFLPVVRWMQSHLELLHEKICDISAVKVYNKQADYAELVFRIAKKLYNPNNPILSTGFSNNDSHVMSRFKFIIHDLQSIDLFKDSGITTFYKLGVVSFTLLLASIEFSASETEVFYNFVEDITIESDFQPFPIEEVVGYEHNSRPASFSSMSSKDTFWILDDPRFRLNSTIDSPPFVSGFRYDSLKPGVAELGHVELPFVIENNRDGIATQYPRYGIQQGGSNNIHSDVLVLQANDARYEHTGELTPDFKPLGGLYLIDVSDPFSPRLLNHIPAFMSIGSTVIKDNKVIASMGLLVKDEFFDMYYLDYKLICYDISNPVKPIELWRSKSLNNEIIYSADFDKNNPNILYAGGSSIYTFEIKGNHASIISKVQINEDPFLVTVINAFPDFILLGTQSPPHLIDRGRNVKQRVALLDESYRVQKLNTLSITFPNSAEEEKPSKIIRLDVIEDNIITVTDKGIFISEINKARQMTSKFSYQTDDRWMAEFIDENIVIANHTFQFIKISDLLMYNNYISMWDLH